VTLPAADHSAGPPTTPGPHIRRRDDLHGRGWLVRVVRKHFRQERMFSDSTWGGAALALAAAQQWRDAQPWFHSPPAGAQGQRRPPPPTAAQVLRYESLLTVQGKPLACAFWCASWTDDQGRTWVRKFSVNFWGEPVARQKALRIHALAQKPPHNRPIHAG